MPTNTQKAASLNANQFADINQSPLNEQQTQEFLRSQLIKNYMEYMQLYDANADQFDPKLRDLPFNKHHLEAFRRLEALPAEIDKSRQDNAIPKMIREGHDYQAMTPGLEKELEDDRKKNPLDSAEYNDYIYNPSFQSLVMDYQKRSAERFKDEILPATRNYYATRGAYNSSNRAAAEQKQLQNHTDRENRDIMKMFAELQPQAAEFALQSKLAQRAGLQQQVNSRQLNKQSFIPTANALQANQANDLSNEAKAIQAQASLAGAHEEKEQQKINIAKETMEAHRKFPGDVVNNLVANVSGLPAQPSSVVSHGIPATPQPPNPYNMASAAAQLGAGNASLFTQPGAVPAHAEGGTVQPGPQSSPQPQQAPPLPQADYTPEQGILLQMVQNFQKQHPLNRMFQTTGAYQMANHRRDPMEVFGEGMLKHGEIEREHEKMSAEVVAKLDDSRNKQQRLLAEMGIKTRETDIDEKYKTDLVKLRREEVDANKSLNQAHASQFAAEAALKQFELEKMKGGVGAKNAINSFGEDNASPESTPLIPPSEGAPPSSMGGEQIGSQPSMSPEQMAGASMEPNQAGAPTPEQPEGESFNPEQIIESSRRQLEKIGEMRKKYGHSELKDEDKTVAHQELEKARQLKELADEGRHITQRLDELNKKIKTGTLLSHGVELPLVGDTGVTNWVRGNISPFEKSKQADLDEFDTLSNNLVGVVQKIDALTGSAKGGSGIGYVNFLKEGKISGSKDSKANANAIKGFDNKFNHLYDINDFVTKSHSFHQISPTEAKTIYEKIADKGVNPIDVFRKKNKGKKSEKASNAPEMGNLTKAALDQEIARAEKKVAEYATPR